MIGEHTVGKTQLILRYAKNDFDMHAKTTLGVEFTPKTITIDGKIIGAQLWDTAGEEKYKSLTKIYYKGAVGAFLVYDITRKETFDKICSQWLNEVKNYSDANIVSILIGNKCDLKDNRQVQIEEASNFAEKNGIAFMETSAKDNTNVSTAFERVLHEIYKIASKNSLKEPEKKQSKMDKGVVMDDEVEEKRDNVKLKKKNTEKKKKKGGCC
jgi:Ras-related protein Rab-11A